MEEFGNYWIERVGNLGEGTFGQVSKVNVYDKTKEYKTEYALKQFITYKLPDEIIPEYTERFQIEVKEQAKCSHNNIVPIYLHNLNSENKWFVMELAEVSLHDELESNDCKEQENRLTESEKLSILNMILKGVKYLHDNGYIHRDLKPLNILKFQNGIYKISDFGLIKDLNNTSRQLTQIGQQIGTPKYMAPEVENGGQYSIKSDIFALGVIMEDLELDDKFDVIVRKFTERRPNNRYGCIDEIIHALDEIKETV